MKPQNVIYDNRGQRGVRCILIWVTVNTYRSFTLNIVTCQQTTLETEEEAVKFINYLWQGGSKFKRSNDFGKTAMNYAESNGLKKIIETLEYIQWKILHDSLYEACLM
jgi:hypothetical protein